MEEEILRDVVGYEGLYLVSNTGFVISTPKQHYCGNNRTYISKARVLKANISNKGYYRVRLYKNGSSAQFGVHRLVANAFIENPDNKPCVNHLDCNPLNNNADNLEWITFSENLLYAKSLGRLDFKKQHQALNEFRETVKKPVIGTSLETGEKIYFESITVAGKHFGNASGGISDCCNNKNKTSRGYAWSFATPDEISRMKQEWKK